MQMQPCPKCGASNSVRRETCFNCGELLDPSATPPEPAPPDSAPPNPPEGADEGVTAGSAKATKGCLGCLGLIVLLLVISYIWGSFSSSGDTTVGIGDDGALRMNAEGPLLLAVDPAAFDELVKSSRAHDAIGIAELMAARRVFECAQGARVRVIDRGMYRRKVRIMSGPQSGLAGWVPVEWVRPL